MKLKMPKLYFKDYVFRSYHFLAEVIFKRLNYVCFPTFKKKIQHHEKGKVRAIGNRKL